MRRPGQRSSSTYPSQLRHVFGGRGCVGHGGVIGAPVASDRVIRPLGSCLNRSGHGGAARSAIAGRANRAACAQAWQYSIRHGAFLRAACA